LEDIYLRTFQREFALRPVEYGIAPRSIYLVGEGYAETRLRAQAMFTDLAAGVFIRPDDPDVAQALLASRHRDLERHRWEVEGLLGMALLAERAGNASAVPTILREFRVKSVAVRRGVAGYGETTAAKIRRLRYYHVMDEQPDWDLELADALASAGDATGARYYYERATKVLLAADAEAGDARLDAAVRGALRCDALVAAAGGNRLYGGGRLFFPVATPASYAAAATVDEFYGNYKPALLRLRAGVYRYPRDVPLALRLASFYARRGLPVKEKEALNAPGVRDDIRVRYARAAAAAREGDRAGARALAGDLERDTPGDILPYLMSAQTERDAGAYDAALAALERARENIPPGSLWASRYAAVIRAEGGDAGPYFVRARRLNPFDAEPYIVDADDLLGQGKAAEGISLLRRAVDVDPASSWARLSLADGYRRLDRDGAVRRAFETALAYDEVGSPVALAYDDYLKNRGDKRARERVLTAAIRRDPTNAALRLRLGEIRLAAGDFERGIQLLRMAVALEPTDAGANAALGYSYLNAGKPAKAIPCLETARSAVPGPEGDNYRVLLADAYIEVGRNEDALRELDAVTQADKLAKAFYLRAKTYYNMGRPEDAAAAAARALALDPSLTDARGFIP
jgi:tetratricopeptide (TPR) repeat protein